MAERGRALRPAGSDDLGLRRALSDRLLPSLVAAMAFLAALTIAAVLAARTLAVQWEGDAGAMMTVQLPQADAAERAAAALRTLPGVATVRVLPNSELAELLRPWLGDVPAMPLPTVLEVHLDPGQQAAAAVAARLHAVAPGAIVEDGGVWLQRLSLLAFSLQACAAAALALVAAIAAAVVAVSTRAGLAVRRDAIEIVHGMGAPDGFIADSFARRTAVLTLAGAVIGTVLAIPVLMALGQVVAPFHPAAAGSFVANVPTGLWFALPALPVAAAVIGWGTAQATVRRWLRRLP